MSGNRQFHKYQKLNKKAYYLKYFLGVLFVVVLAIFYNLVKLIKSVAVDREKLVFVVRQSNSSTHIHIIDPEIRAYTIISVPGQTLVDASSSLGQWRLSSLWELGKSDKVGGEYVRKSIVKEFHFPVEYWLDAGEDIIGQNIVKDLNIFSGKYKSNLPFKEKAAIFYFLYFRVSENDKHQIDLAETTYVKQTKLPDGENGYIVGDVFPNFLLPLFSQKSFSYAKIKIQNQGTDNSVTAKVSKTIEVLGGKVALVERGDKKDFSCEVWAENINNQKLLKSLYNCKDLNDSNEVVNTGFDVIISLGTKFHSFY